MTIQTLKNITYDLVKMKDTLIFQVLKQDKSWNSAYCNKIHSFEAKNGVFVKSVNNPQLSFFHMEKRVSFIQNTICIWGKDSWNNNKPFVLDCYNKIKVDNYYNKINSAMDEWDKMVEKLKESKTK